MTTQELINELQTIIDNEPHKADVDVFIYIQEYIEDLPDHGESPNPIILVDDAISDRVDINI